jgi:hypothetical protein
VKNFLISYDLRKTRNYDILFEAIKKIAKGYARPLLSVWIIGSDGDAKTIRDTLKAHMDDDDGLLVVELAKGSWATKGIVQVQTDWLQSYV